MQLKLLQWAPSARLMLLGSETGIKRSKPRWSKGLADHSSHNI